MTDGLVSIEVVEQPTKKKAKNTKLKKKVQIFNFMTFVFYVIRSG